LTFAMRTLPLADPGTPDTRSATRFLLWHVRLQWRTLLLGMFLSSLWMASGAFGPAIIGKAIDEGVVDRDNGRLLYWGIVLFAVGVGSAAAGILSHRNAVQRWLVAAYTTMQLVARQASRLGGQLPKRIATGEVIAVGASDISQFGNMMEQLSRVIASIVSFVIVAVILVTISVPLGLLVLIGAPVLLIAVAPLLRPLHTRQGRQRAAVGDLSTQGTDIVSGLRVLRGIGGEDTFSANYARTSQTVRRHGVAVSGMDALVEASSVLVPGVFVVLLTWLGARAVISGSMSVGELVALYGYAAFLMEPLRTFLSFADRITRAHVAAKRSVRVLSLTSELPEPSNPQRLPDPATIGQPGKGDLVDPDSGLRVVAGALTAVVSARPEDAAALADRLGRYTDGLTPVTLAGVPLRELALADVRSTVLVNDTDSALFAGTLRNQVDVRGTHTDAEILAALHLASAEDVLEAVPDGLDSEVEEKGRGFSGGQRQRVILARALLLDPPVLVLVEPTSAVDAHTEARIADRLHASRAGRTTVVTTSSPLVLDRCDRVALLRDGVVVAEGTHHELLTTEPRYRAVVTREQDDSETAEETTEEIAGADELANRRNVGAEVRA
jgi:ABC-type multidrug transport system fused ATPase/permease subunit